MCPPRTPSPLSSSRLYFVQVHGKNSCWVLLHGTCNWSILPPPKFWWRARTKIQALVSQYVCDVFGCAWKFWASSSLKCLKFFYLNLFFSLISTIEKIIKKKKTTASILLNEMPFVKCNVIRQMFHFSRVFWKFWKPSPSSLKCFRSFWLIFFSFWLARLKILLKKKQRQAFC